MRSTGRHRRRASRPPKDRAPGRAIELTIAATVLTAAVAWFAHAFWVCVPAALAVTAGGRGRLSAGLGSAVVLGAAFAASRTHAPLYSIAVTAISVTILVGVRERLARERDIARASARADPLTGVGNRRAMLERIEYEIARHARTRRSFSVLVLDLDGFKLLNDRFGHLAGDDLLRDVAGALREAIRDQDTLARMGGDEFCVLAPETTASGAHTFAARAVQAVSQVTAGIEALGASAGTALFPDDGRSATALLHAADQRLLEMKRHRYATARPRAA